MVPEAHVCHRTPRRLRLKIPERKGDAAYFVSLAEHLAGVPQVKDIEVNPLTASVLLFSEAAEEALQVVAGLARDKGLFQLQAAPGRTPLTRRVSSGVGALDRRLRSLTAEEVGLAEAAFLALLGLGLYQIAVAGVSAPPWHAALWYALGLFMYAQQRPAPEA